ncbi:MAG TPA: vWA domain-containing protein [Kofleriaceae bacterium]|nr:vWA domain-containing protein [Kofleriaceae bacterium]
MRRIDRQRGAIAVTAGVATILLSMLALGAVHIGRMVALRDDAQRAADSASLAASQAIRERGMPFDLQTRQAAEAVGRKNSKLPVNFVWNVAESSTAVDFTVNTSIDMEVPALAFTDTHTQVLANATGRVPQSKYDEAERRYPKLTMVLDYSGSMDLPFSGGSGKAIDVLESSVRNLLNANLRIDYGAVFFSTGVFKTIGIGPSSPGQINATMNTYGAGGNTNTAAGLNTGRNVLLAAADTGRYILLVSDGEPCCDGNSFAAARAAADAAFAAGITIYSLEIRRSGSSSALDQFMTYVAGSPGSRHDPSFHFVATSAASLTAKFQDIVASIVCKVGPLSPAPSDPALLRVFLKSGSSERRLLESSNLAADRTLERYQYSAADQTVRLTERACDAVIDSGDDVVVRFDQPSLTD